MTPKAPLTSKQLPYQCYLQVAVLGFGLSIHDFWQMTPAEFKALWQGYKAQQGGADIPDKKHKDALIREYGRTGRSINTKQK